MKKLSLLSLGILSALSMSAQTSLVKEVERQMKSSPEKYQANMEMLAPAFTNPETAENAYVWFVAGKGGFNFYDQLFGFKQIGRDVDNSAMGHALIDGYDYLLKALKYDPVEEKGKIKTKYTKDIYKLLQSHYNDFNNAAIFMWEVKDYDGAYDAWTIYANMPENPQLKDAGLKQLPDTILSDIYYNRALAAWQAEKLENALESFDKAMSLGYNKQQIFDYAIGVSSALGDTEKMAKYATEAYKLFGSEGNNYVGLMVNDKLKKEQYREAEDLLKEMIAQNPNDAQVYYILGYVYDNENDLEKASENYHKALEVNPSHAKAHYQSGRLLYNQALMEDEKVNTKSAQEYNAIRENKIDPLFKSAAQYLEKAYELDPENNYDALNLLRTIYYNLNDNANLERVEALMNN